MQDQLSQSTVQSLVVQMQGQQQPFHLFEHIEDAYFRAATIAAGERGLTTEAFVQQQLSSWSRRMGIHPMRYSAAGLQAVQSNSGGRQGVHQVPASNLTGHRVNDSPEQASPQSRDLMKYLNPRGTNSYQNRYGLRAHQGGFPITEFFDDDDFASRRRQSPSIQEPNSRAITYEHEENSINQLCSFNLSEMSCAEEDNQEPVISSYRPPKKLSLKDYGKIVQDKLKAENRNAPNRTNMSSSAQQFEGIQTFSQPGNAINPLGHSPYLMALEQEREDQMNSANRSNLSGSPQTLLLGGSPVKVSNTQVNGQGLPAQHSQRLVNSINSPAQVVRGRVHPPTQPQNHVRSQAIPFSYQTP